MVTDDGYCRVRLPFVDLSKLKVHVECCVNFSHFFKGGGGDETSTEVPRFNGGKTKVMGAILC